MQTIKNITAHADYSEAVAKLDSYRKALAIEQQLFDELDAARVAVAKPAEQDAIELADKILSSTPMGESLGTRITENARKIAALRRAIEQQQREVTRIRDEHSRRVCREMVPEHVAEVERVVKAVEALNAANKAEQALRAGIEAAGYSSTPLPAMAFMPRGEDYFDTRAVDFGYAPAWSRDVAEYIAGRVLPVDAAEREVPAAPKRISKPAVRVSHPGEGELIG